MCLHLKTETRQFDPGLCLYLFIMASLQATKIFDMKNSKGETLLVVTAEGRTCDTFSHVWKRLQASMSTTEVRHTRETVDACIYHRVGIYTTLGLD